MQTNRIIKTKTELLLYFFILFNIVAIFLSGVFLRTFYHEGADWYYQIIHSGTFFRDVYFNRYSDLIYQVPTILLIKLHDYLEVARFAPHVFSLSYEIGFLLFYGIVLYLTRKNSLLFLCFNLSFALFILPAQILPLMMAAQSCMYFYLYLAADEHENRHSFYFLKFMAIILIGFGHETGIMFLSLIFFRNLIEFRRIGRGGGNIIMMALCVCFFVMHLRLILTYWEVKFKFLFLPFYFHNLLSAILMIIGTYFFISRNKKLSILLVTGSMISLIVGIFNIHTISFNEIRNFRIYVATFSLMPLLIYFLFQRIKNFDSQQILNILRLLCCLAFFGAFYLSLNLTNEWKKYTAYIGEKMNNSNTCVEFSKKKFHKLGKLAIPAAMITEVSIALQFRQKINSIAVYSKKDAFSGKLQLISACDVLKEERMYRKYENSNKMYIISTDNSIIDFSEIFRK